ncbi:MAG TPA: hypothetical protein VJ916_07585, partial [Anaerovoracaceae bacterium]|nr:hypothetical protein [Anaerovoracaceae bacterium]
NMIQNSLEQLDSLLDIRDVTEDFLYKRYDCNAIKVDSSLKVEKFILNLKEVNYLLDSLLLNYKMLTMESIVPLYDKLIAKTNSPHSSIIIGDIFNRKGVQDCDHNSLFLSDYKNYWGVVTRFEHIILSIEIKNNDTLTPFMAFELLSDEYYDQVVKKSYVPGKFPYYEKKITDIIGRDIRTTKLFWRSDYKNIKNGLLDKIRNINLDSSSRESDYLKDVFLIKQNAFYLQNNPLPELEWIFRERLADWVDNGFLYFVLQTTPQRSDSTFIKRIVLEILYTEIQEGYMDNDHFMRVFQPPND